MYTVVITAVLPERRECFRVSWLRPNRAGAILVYALWGTPSVAQLSVLKPLCTANRGEDLLRLARDNAGASLCCSVSPQLSAAVLPLKLAYHTLSRPRSTRHRDNRCSWFQRRVR